MGVHTDLGGRRKASAEEFTEQFAVWQKDFKATQHTNPTRERGFAQPSLTRRVRVLHHHARSLGLALLAPATGRTGNNSSVVADRRGSANPRTHFSDAFVSYFPA